MLVDAKAGAVPFYLSLGFRALDVHAGALDARPEPLPMFLALAAIPSLKEP